MKIKPGLIFLLFVTLTANAANKEGQVRYNASTADTKLDLSLGKLNLRADGNINEFIKALGFKYQVPTTKIENLIVDYNFTAADTYMAVSIGNMTGRTLDEVASVYRSNKAKGWGFVAKKMGIKPGSREFHQIKQGSASIFNEAGNGLTANKPSKNNAGSKGKGNSRDKAKNKNKGKNRD